MKRNINVTFNFKLLLFLIFFPLKLDVSDSDEEKEDLKKFYLKFKGDMNKIMECVCCATLDDEERFSKILKELIDSGEIPDYPAFTKEPKRKKLARKRKVYINFW